MSLTKLIDDGSSRIGAHARAAGPAVRTALFFRPHFTAAGLFHDFLADAGEKFLQAPFVLMKIESDSRQRQVPAITMARIEIATVVPVRQSLGLHVEIHRAR